MGGMTKKVKQTKTVAPAMEKSRRQSTSPVAKKIRHDEPMPMWGSQQPIMALENKCAFTVQVNMLGYYPENITTKSFRRDGKNFLLVEAKHQDSEEGFEEEQHFKRRYKVPDNIDLEKFISKLETNGLLTIQAPTKMLERKAIERIVPVKLEAAPAATPMRVTSYILSPTVSPQKSHQEILSQTGAETEDIQDTEWECGF